MYGNGFYVTRNKETAQNFGTHAVEMQFKGVSGSDGSSGVIAKYDLNRKAFYTSSKLPQDDIATSSPRHFENVDGVLDADGTSVKSVAIKKKQ
ncbi:hypothetical protein [Streptomyces sp. NPDC001774]